MIHRLSITPVSVRIRRTRNQCRPMANGRKLQQSCDASSGPDRASRQAAVPSYCRRIGFRYLLDGPGASGFEGEQEEGWQTGFEGEIGAPTCGVGEYRYGWN